MIQEESIGGKTTGTTRLVDAVTTPLLLKMTRRGRLHPRQLVTHRFPLSDIMNVYDTFGNAAGNGR